MHSDGEGKMVLSQIQNDSSASKNDCSLMSRELNGVELVLFS